MQKHTKIFIIFALLIFTLLSLKFYFEYKDMQKLQKMVVKDEAKSLLALYTSFRKTYQDIFINQHIQIDKKTINLLPVRTSVEISKSFTKLVGNRTTIRTVSNRPRNLANKANTLEMNIIDFFNKNPKEDSYFKVEDNFTFYYAQPLYITKSCLKCHGKKENTIKTVREQYNTAYDYEIGDLRGIISIKISKKNIIENINNNFYRGIQTAIIVYILFLLAIYLMIRIIIKNEKKYTDTLEKKVTEQVDRIRKQDNTLLQQSKMADMGEMIGNIAHQWRQPLSVISTSASGLKLKNEFDILDEEYLNSSVDSIVQSTQYLSQTIDDFRNFIKGDKETKKFKLKDNINKNLEILKGTLKYNEIKVIVDINDNFEIESYDNELTQVFINIINNAKDALNDNKIEDKLIFISIKKDKEYLFLSIKDNAKGINSNIIEKIFEPYFTTKHQSQGTGLGLYMTQKIITQSLQGEILVKNISYKYNNTEYYGAEFILKLPIKLK